jgi:hypothetical protein
MWPQKQNATLAAQISMVWKIGYFGKYRINTFKTVKCGAGKEIRRPVGPIV